MPTPNTALEALDRTFYDADVKVPQFFDTGHALTADEAEWANGQLATTIGNRVGSRIRALQKADPKAKFDVQKLVDEVFASYDFAGNRGTGEGKAAADPAASIVRKLAEVAIKAKIVAKGLRVRDFMTTMVKVGEEEVSKLKALTDQYIENHPELRDQAEAQLADAKAAGEAEDDSELNLAA